MPLRSDPSIWHSMPGVVVAYQPIGARAASAAALNMAHGGDGRYVASPGAAPIWSAADGWQFSPSQYLSTGYAVPGPESSLLVSFSTTVSDGQTVAGTLSFRIRPTWWGAHYYINGGNVSASGDVLSGVLGIAGGSGYRDGVVDGNITTSSHTGDLLLVIGGYYNGSTLYEPYTGVVRAMLMAERILSAAEMWLAAQQMKYCHVNPAWSVWSPSRRWFFIPPPPPPAAATPVLSTIYLNTADIGDTSLFDEASGTDIDSTYARTGANSFRFHADGAYLLANLTSNAAKYARFGLLALGVPPATARICAWLEDGTEHVSLWLTDGLELQMRQGSTVIQTSPTTLELGVWYCIEAKVVVHTTTGRFQVRIDGVDDMSAIGICTDADVDGAINQIQFEPPGEDVCIDDIMVREDGWCGTGGVYVVVPTMDGMVKDWASGDYTAIAETPPTFDEYIEDGAGGGYTQLVRHSGVGDLDVNVVGVFALGRTDASAEMTFQAAARSILTDNVGYAQDLDTIGVYARLLMTTDPNGTVAWTVYAVNNALQLGVKS